MSSGTSLGILDVESGRSWLLWDAFLYVFLRVLACFDWVHSLVECTRVRNTVLNEGSGVTVRHGGNNA